VDAGRCDGIFFTTSTFFSGMRRETMHTRNYIYVAVGERRFLIWRYTLYERWCWVRCADEKTCAEWQFAMGRSIDDK
jgi:hypothetical protein